MNRIARISSLSAVGVLCAGLSTAQAAETVTLDVDAASIMRKAMPDRHYNYTWLTATTDSTTAHAGMIRFDLSGLTLPDIEDAEVRMELVSATATAGNVEYLFYGITPGTAGENWTTGVQQDVEGVAHPAPLTWNNAPGLASDEDGLALDTSELWGDGAPIGSLQAQWNDYAGGDIFTFTSSNLIEFLTAVLESDNQLANLIFVPVDDVPYANRVTWVGRNHEGTIHGAGDVGPQLQLTLVPEPSAMALAGLGGVLVLARRRSA